MFLIDVFECGAEMRVVGTGFVLLGKQCEYRFIDFGAFRVCNSSWICLDWIQVVHNGALSDGD